MRLYLSSHNDAEDVFADISIHALLSCQLQDFTAEVWHKMRVQWSRIWKHKRPVSLFSSDVKYQRINGWNTEFKTPQKHSTSMLKHTFHIHGVMLRCNLISKKMQALQTRHALVPHLTCDVPPDTPYVRHACKLARSEPFFDLYHHIMPLPHPGRCFLPFFFHISTKITPLILV